MVVLIDTSRLLDSLCAMSIDCDLRVASHSIQESTWLHPRQGRPDECHDLARTPADS